MTGKPAIREPDGGPVWEETPEVRAEVRASDEYRLRRWLRGLISVRLVAVISALIPISVLALTLDGSIPGSSFLIVWAGGVFAATLIYAVLLARRKLGARRQAYIQFACDVLFVTLLLWRYGAVNNPLSILYLVVITVASVLLRRRAGIGVASLAALGYATVLTLELGGQTPTPQAQAASFGVLAYNAIIHLAGFYAVAFMTSSLARNVTRAEIALQEKREDLADLRVAYRDIVGSIPSGILTTDVSGTITSANEAAEEILHLSADRLSRLDAFALGLFDEEGWASLTARASAGERIREEADYRAEDADLRIGYAVSPLTRADGRRAGYLLIFQDLTEWRHLQEEMRLKDRMAAVGEMASGLAHEVGNPLAAISGSVQMMSGRLDEDTPQHRLLDIILKESRRLDRTIKGFLQFARPKARSSVRFDIAALLAENVALLRNSDELSHQHKVELELDPPRAMLLADPDQISQIFWNLTRNALRATASGGTLRVVGKVVGEDIGTYRMQYIDDGCGMTVEQRTTAFHPFRSFFAGGTGIGMAIVYRIVQEHGGRLWVEGRQGEGTKITVEFPGVESPPAVAQAGVPAPSEPVSKSR